MKILENESLALHTTFRMGGIARRMYIPENIEELKAVIEKTPEALEYMIGGGSNLLINDQREFAQVLGLNAFNTQIERRGDGRYCVGASVRLQKLIKTIHEDGYGGIEYLYSVPGLVGGAVYMNAGRRRMLNLSISDYIENVTVLLEGKLQTFAKVDCGFGYRQSLFQKTKGCVIVSVLFHFPQIDKNEAKRRVEERLVLCRQVQDRSAPSFGTVFSEANKHIMTLVLKMRYGHKSGCRYSPKTKNWMLNGPEGTFKQANTLIKRVEKLHRVLGRKCSVEVKIWE